MAETISLDLIEPEVFNPYVIQRTAELTNFYLGGIVQNDAALNTLASSGGSLINMPFYNDLAGESQVLSESAGLNVNNITASLDKARLHMRGNAWGVNEIAASLSGSDPMGAVGDLVAEFWARDMQRMVFSTLAGVFADNLANTVDAENPDGDMSFDIGGVYTQAGLLDAVQTMGDNSTKITAIAMHSRVANVFKKAKVIETEQRTGDTVAVPRIDDIRVIENDSLPFDAATGTYTSYLFGDGAIAFGQGGAKTPTETDRDSLAGVDVLINRQHFILHPRGVAFQDASVAGLTPSNLELANAANHSRVYERKNVRLASVTGTLV